MFGLIVAGRLVDTSVQQVSENQFLFNIPDADSINHIVIFMTGQTPFPEGLGGAVYFCWPNPVNQSWQLLGYLTNAKPSATFRVNRLRNDETNATTANLFGHTTFQQSHMAQIGISVEPLHQLSQLTPATAAAVSNLQPFVEFSKTITQNLYNYVSSFAVTQSQMTPCPSETFVPISVLHKWYKNFERKMEQDPYFWRK